MPAIERIENARLRLHRSRTIATPSTSDMGMRVDKSGHDRLACGVNLIGVLRDGNVVDSAYFQDFTLVNDQDALSRLARLSLETTPELDAFFEILVDVRNRNWLATLTRLLESPDRAGTTVFVAVGSLHLVGPGNLPDLLRQAGYRAEEPTRPRPREPAAQGTRTP